MVCVEWQYNILLLTLLFFLAAYDNEALKEEKGSCDTIGNHNKVTVLYWVVLFA